MNPAMKLLLLTSVAALATGSAPAFAQGVKHGSARQVRADFAMICHATEQAGATKVKDPSRKAEKVADYLLSHIKTEQAMSVMRSMAEVNPADRSATLKKAAHDAGYQGSCPFADEK